VERRVDGCLMTPMTKRWLLDLRKKGLCTALPAASLGLRKDALACFPASECVT
jgi:hypothetical protein